MFVAGLGTGGTLMGCARRLRRDRPDLQVVAAEPLPGEGIDGLRSLEDGYTPEILDLSLLDRKLLVSNEDSVRGLRALAREEGSSRASRPAASLHAARARRARARRAGEHRHGARRRRLEVPLGRPLGHARGRARRAHGAGHLVVRLARAAAGGDEMVAHARSELPNEACGIFGGTLEGELRTFHPARNADASPYRYSVDADDLLRITLAIDDARRRGRRDLPLAHAVARHARRAPTWSSRSGPRRPT